MIASSSTQRENSGELFLTQTMLQSNKPNKLETAGRSDSVEIIIKSNEATLDDLAKKIILKDDVVVIFNGIKLKSSQLNLNINNQNINSEAPVIVDFSNSYIKADKLDSDDYSKIIRFKGNVESVFDIDDF